MNEPDQYDEETKHITLPHSTLVKLETLSFKLGLGNAGVLR